MQHFVNISTRKSKTKQNKKKKKEFTALSNFNENYTFFEKNGPWKNAKTKKKNESFGFNLFIKQVVA
jgi:hypothetical protein